MTLRVTRSASGASAPKAAAAAAASPAVPQAPKTVAPGTTVKATAKRKTKAEVELNAMPPPETPPAKKSRRSKKDMPEPPALTPTPSAVKLIAGMPPPKSRAKAAGASSSSPKKAAAAAALDRPADPNVTNAVLTTPRGTRHTAYKPNPLNPPEFPSSKKAAAAAAATTGTLLEQACAHLIAADARMRPLIEAHPCPLFTAEALAQPVEPFQALASGILAQQVSGAAARSIKRKFQELFAAENSETSKKGGKAEAEKKMSKEDAAEAVVRDQDLAFPTPAQVVKKRVEDLRPAGLSQRKAEYIHGLAEKFVAGELSAEWLVGAPYDEIVERLVAVRGLGKWSVEMFSCFALKRMDVFSTGDLGVQRGMAAFIGRDVQKLRNKGGKWKYMSEQDMEEMAARFAPYRTLFMWYMWRVEDVDVAALQDAK